VEVDEARSDDLATGVDRAGDPRRVLTRPEEADPPADDRDVPGPCRGPRPVDDRAAGNEQLRRVAVHETRPRRNGAGLFARLARVTGLGRRAVRGFARIASKSNAEGADSGLVRPFELTRRP